MPKVEVGQRIGLWTVLALGRSAAKNGRTRRVVLCNCQCGNQKNVTYDSLAKGESTSCGCNRVAKMASSIRVHGETKSKLHKIWMGMRSRCNNPHSPNYKRYGGRGISVCARWDDFLAFKADMGEPPSATHSLEREDVNGNYEPGNVRWATPREQSRNRSNTIYAEIDGVRMCLKDAADLRGFKYATVRDRIQRLGWTIDQALNTPVIPQSEIARDAVNRFAPSPRTGVTGPSFPSR